VTLQLFLQSVDLGLIVLDTRSQHQLIYPGKWPLSRNLGLQATSLSHPNASPQSQALDTLISVSPQINWGCLSLTPVSWVSASALAWKALCTSLDTLSQQRTLRLSYWCKDNNAHYIGIRSCGRRKDEARPLISISASFSALTPTVG